MDNIDKEGHPGMHSASKVESNFPDVTPSDKLSSVTFIVKSHQFLMKYCIPWPLKIMSVAVIVHTVVARTIFEISPLGAGGRPGSHRNK